MAQLEGRKNPQAQHGIDQSSQTVTLHSMMLQ